MSKYKKLYNIISDFYTVTIVETDDKGKILKNILNNHPKSIGIENIQEVFDKKECTKLEETILKKGKTFRYCKLNKKYGENTYAQVRIYPIKKNRRDIVINYSTEGLERNIKEQKEIEKLIRLSELDPMTKTLNRRGAWRRTKRILDDEDGDKIIGMIFIDVDNLKTINDTKGHKKGDKAIKQISESLLEMKRERDIIMRYGGDEFLIVIEEPSRKRSSARGFAKRLHSEFSKDKYLTTVSIGLHAVKLKQFRSVLGNEKRLEKKWFEEIDKADKAVYQSKKRGKSRISTSPSFDKIYS